MGRAPSKVTANGTIYWRDLRAEHTEQRSGDAWTEHYSFGMGARTDRHAAEIGAKCAAAGLDCTFDSKLRLKVNSASHQRKLMKVVLGPDYVNRDSCRG